MDPTEQKQKTLKHRVADLEQDKNSNSGQIATHKDETECKLSQFGAQVDNFRNGTLALERQLAVIAEDGTKGRDELTLQIEHLIERVGKLEKEVIED